MNKYRVTVHLFYPQDSGNVKKEVHYINLIDVEYSNVPNIINTIVTLHYSTCSWHEIKTVSTIKDEIYIRGELV